MKIDYSRFPWFDRDLLALVVPFLKDNPELGRPTLSKLSGLSMYKCEQVLAAFNDYDLYQYLDEPDPVDAILAALDLTIEPMPPTEDDEWLEDGGENRFMNGAAYYYDQGADKYVVTLRIGANTQTVNVPGNTHRALRAAYSHWDGDRTTLNQMAKQFGVSRRWLHAYKSAMGWTHDQDPFTNEEVAANDPEELAMRAVQRKRSVIERRYQNLLTEADRRDADRYRQLEVLVLDPLMESLRESLPTLTVPALDLKPPASPFAAVISPADLHFGKLGRAGRVDDPYDRVTAESRLVASTTALLRDVAAFGRPERIVVGMAGDWFHVDNAFGGTTKGTSQDVDGSLWQVVDGGVNLAIKFMTLLAQATDHVQIVKVSGNHDSWSTLFLLKAMQLVAPSLGNVDIIMSERDRVYITYGSVLMGFTHGDNWVNNRTSLKILTEPPKDMMQGTTERIWFTGHRHYERYSNDGAVYHYQLPSLSGDDAWHDDRGYTESTKALTSFIVRRDEGVVGNLLAKVNK